MDFGKTDLYLTGGVANGNIFHIDCELTDHNRGINEKKR